MAQGNARRQDIGSFPEREFFAPRINDVGERRADQCGRPVERARDGEDVTGECIERVVAVGGPFAFTVAAQVDGVRTPTLVGECAECGSPGMACLAAAVEQNRRWIGGFTGDIGREAVAVPPDEFDHAAPHVTRSTNGIRSGMPNLLVWLGVYRRSYGIDPRSPNEARGATFVGGAETLSRSIVVRM